MARNIEMTRSLPQDTTAEAAVLSAMMIDNYSVSRAIEMLKEQDFYKAAHKMVFKAILGLFEENIEIDVITLVDRLKTMGLLEKVGGISYINELSDVVLSGANINFHSKIVLEKGLLRHMINASNQIIEECYSSQKPVVEIIDQAEQLIFKVAEGPNKQSFTRVSDIIPETLQEIEEVATTKTSVQGVATGFHKLDRMTGGFKAGQLLILAARPAMGKTSFALNVAFNAAMYQDMKVGIFTMEMSNEELLKRMMSFASEVPMDNILKGYGMNEEKLIRIAQVADALSVKDIFIDDNAGNTVIDIRAKCRRLKAEIKGLDLIVIDYLQLMSGSGGQSESRQQEISTISRNLKILAKELECPVIALSQLNRSLENRDNKRPKLSDLRESGAIEQDADMVMFIYRDVVYNPETENKNIAEVIIGKNRHGATGTVETIFIPEFTAFRNVDHHESDF